MTARSESNVGVAGARSAKALHDPLQRDPKGRRGVWRLLRLVGVLRPHWARFLLATLSLFAGGAISLIYPQAVRFAIDQGVSSGSLDTLNQIAIGLVALFVFQAALTWTRHYLMSWLGQRAVAELRRRVFGRLLSLDPGWFHERSSGEIVGRLASDVTVVEGVVGSEISLSLRNGLQLFGGLGLLFWENPSLAALMLSIVPPLVLGIYLLGIRIRRRSRAVQDRLAEASARVQESVAAIETVQGFVREEAEVDRYATGVEAAFEATRRLAIYRGAFMAMASFGGLSAIALMVWAGGRAVAAGEMTGGDLAAFILYTTMVAVSTGSLAGLWGSLSRAAGATERLFEIIDEQPSIRSPEDAVPLPAGRGHIVVESVSHAYASRPDAVVLDGIELELAPGETVALVGRSGGGKTTLAKMLARLIDPTEGRITLEGVDLRDLDLGELRGAVATVAQEPTLFTGTLADNIAYARPEASREEIERAARDAAIGELAETLPDGWDTEVGERGVQLSGGQRQRVALARALLADPRVLILDEATSHLDAESEAAIQRALDVLLEGRTALIIAHRLSTIRRADRILVIDQGRVVEAGTHEALVAEDGLYRRLVELQRLTEGEPFAAPLDSHPQNERPAAHVG